MRTTSIKDVAERAQVSISTASYALNGVPKVSPETREKVLQAARDLQYKPNSFARSLKTHKTKTIGLFVSHIDSPYYFEVVNGIEEVLTAAGYDFVIARICTPSGFGTGYNLIREQRIDGAMLLGGSYIPKELICEMAGGKMPIAITDCAYDECFAPYKNLHFMDIDNWGGIRLVLTHLRDQGYKKIAFVAGKELSYDGSVRESAYRSVMAELGLSAPAEWILRGDYREDQAFNVTKALLDFGAERPDAFCCANDQMAFGVIGAINSLGLSVPHDFAVTGFDDIRQSAYMAPGITTVNRNDEGMGTLIAQDLLRAIDGQELEQRQTQEVKLMVRGSSATKIK
jgi:LacI family transcriptional regulator